MTPTDGSVTGLDHVGFIVADLDASARLLTQLGFRQTVRADHTRTDAAGKLVSAGSSQHSVMLRHGYIELMQITDPDAGHQLTAATRVRYGLHVLALGTSDAPACRDARVDGGVTVGPLLHWARPIREGSCQGEARFCYFDSRWDPQDPSYICWVQHLTPQLLRPPHLLEHENGALALTGVSYRGPRRLAQTWIAQLLQAGAQPGATRDNGASLLLAEARIEVDIDDKLLAVRPVAVALAFADLAAMQARCRRLGLPARPCGDGALAIDLLDAFGLHLICTQASGALLP